MAQPPGQIKALVGEDRDAVLLWQDGAMQTPIAQAAALTIAGNAARRTRLRADFWPAASVFVFCKRVAFADLADSIEGSPKTLIADDPAKWITNIVQGGSRGLRLHHVARNDPRISDRQSVGLIGGGARWMIESAGPDASDFWEAKWQVGNQNDPDRKIWDVLYWRIARDRPTLQTDPGNILATRRQMDECFHEIEEFARRQGLSAFAQSFRRAVELLHDANPLAQTYHSDLTCDAEVAVEAQQILAAIQAGWVFGGMGSWNDLSFSEKNDQARYGDLSKRLFMLFNRALCEAVNTSFPS